MAALGNKRTCNFHNKAPVFGAFLIRSIGLLGYDVDRSEALGAFLDIKLNFLAFIQGFESVSHYWPEVDKYVLSFCLGNKSKSFWFVEPLYDSCIHSLYLQKLINKYVIADLNK